MYPRLLINLKKFEHNAKTLLTLCKNNNITLAAVTKVFGGDPKLVRILCNLEVDFLADSRLKNIAKYPKKRPETILLRLPSLYEAKKTAANCDISCNSEISTINALGKAAAELNINHGIILMIDLGDLREGIYHRKRRVIFQTAEAVLAHKNLTLKGVGANLTCYGSVLPTTDNMEILCKIAKGIENRFKIKLSISGGNSSSLYMLEDLPRAVNNLRLGEAIIRGVETAYGRVFPGLKEDVVILEADIIELMKKPSMPEGELGMNAFGEHPVYEDKGIQTRAILAIGRQDIDQNDMISQTPHAEIIGSSSDHTIVDVTKVRPALEVGDTLRFSLTYGGILSAFTSEYVYRKYV